MSKKRSPLPVKKRPVSRRRSRPPARRPDSKGGKLHRRFRLGAFVARKVEEHTRLARDAFRITIALALAVILFLLIGAISRTIINEQSARLAPSSSAPNH